MPRAEDFVFLNKAKEQGLMTQDQVEECVDLLCALEHVGSAQRAWDVAARKGYVSASKAAELGNSSVGAETAKPVAEPPPPAESEPERPPEEPPSSTEREQEKAPEKPPHPPPPELEVYVPVGDEGSGQDEAAEEEPAKPEGVGLIELPGQLEAPEEEEAEEAVAEEASVPLEFDEGDEEGGEGEEEAESEEEPEAVGLFGEESIGPEVRGHKLAFVKAPEEIEFVDVGNTPVSIGANRRNTFAIGGVEVAPRHARITPGAAGVTLWDMTSERRTKVNGEVVNSAKLKDYDLIRLGEALLVYVPDYGDAPARLLASPGAAGGNPYAMLSVLSGPQAGSVFYVGEAPALIGKHKLAGVRIDAPDIDLFHAHLVGEPEGLAITNLNSREGVYVNNNPVSRKILRTDDRATVGETDLKVQILREYIRSEDDSAPPKAAELRAELKEKEEVSLQEGEGSEPPPLFIDIPGADELREGGAEPAPGERLGAKKPEKEVQSATSPSDSAGADLGAPSEGYSAGQLLLTCIQGKSQGTTWALDKRTMPIGRDRMAAISVRDLSVSRYHAMIIITDEGVEARDLGSRNGIYVNERRVETALLKPGDTLRVGQSAFLVKPAEEADD